MTSPHFTSMLYLSCPVMVAISHRWLFKFKLIKIKFSFSCFSSALSRLALLVGGLCVDHADNIPALWGILWDKDMGGSLLSYFFSLPYFVLVALPFEGEL